jgi:hypothetical protein
MKKKTFSRVARKADANFSSIPESSGTPKTLAKKLTAG